MPGSYILSVASPYMFVFCFWGLVLAEQKKWMRSRVAFLIAALFKYYAIFPMLGIATWQMFEERKNTKELLKSAFLWMMFVLPPIAYVILFIKLDIANPITEYRESDGHGHLSSFQFLTQGHFYLRWFTWVLIKLTTLGGGIMALTGLFFARGKKLEWFYFCLAASFGFSILFAPSFFVHDYYALMYLPLLWLGWGYFFKTFESKISGKFATAASVAFCGVFLIWNQVHAHFSNSRQVVLESAMQVQEKCLEDHAVQATDYGVFISTYSQPILPFLSHRTGWMVSLPQLEQPWHNLYLNEQTFIPRMKKYFDLSGIVYFSSTYYFVSRVVYAWLAKTFKFEMKHESWMNRLALLLPSWGKGGVQRLFIFQKKAA